MRRVLIIIKERCIDIETEFVCRHKRDITGTLLRNKPEVSKNECSDSGTSKEENGIGWLEAGTWILTGNRRGSKKSYQVSTHLPDYLGQHLLNVRNVS